MSGTERAVTVISIGYDSLLTDTIAFISFFDKLNNVIFLKFVELVIYDQSSDRFITIDLDTLLDYLKSDTLDRLSINEDTALFAMNMVVVIYTYDG